MTTAVYRKSKTLEEEAGVGRSRVSFWTAVQDGRVKDSHALPKRVSHFQKGLEDSRQRSSDYTMTQFFLLTDGGESQYAGIVLVMT